MPDATLSPSVLKRLAGYTATAGAVLAVAPAASGQVTYTDLDPDEVISTGSEFAIDFDGDGVDDLSFQAGEGAGSATTARINLVNVNSAASSVNAVAGIDAPYFAASQIASASRLALGDAVGPNLAFEAEAVFNIGVLASVFSGTPYYNFSGAEGYVGFRFQAGGGTTHYGWARIAATADATQLTIFEYAFQATPDTPLNAGVTVATEPDALPDGYVFSPIGPNPIHTSAQFTVQVAEPENVRVSVYDLLGREVAGVFDGELASGVARRMELNVSELPAGTYVVRVRGESFDTVRRVTVAH